MGEYTRLKATITPYLLFQFGVLLLGMDQVEDDIECSSENEGEEKAEPSQVGISLRTAPRSHKSDTSKGNESSRDTY